MALIIVKNIYKYLHAEIAASTLDEGHGRYREAGIRATHEDEVGKL